MTKKILASRQVSHVISKSAHAARASGLEFGGSLLAHEGPEEILIAYALPTGPGADQGPAHLTTDAGYQNRSIRTIKKKFPQLAYVGDWHIHPMYLPELSSTDRRTVRRMLIEEHVDRTRLFLLLGTFEPGGRPLTLAFAASLDEKRRLSIDRLEIDFVDDDSPSVTSRLDRPLEQLETLLAPSVAEREATEFSHSAAERISKDVTALKSDLNAETEFWLGADILALLVERNHRRALVLFPEEYPYGAPQVFAGSLRAGPLSPIPLRYAWSSRHSLVDPVAEALRHPASRDPDQPRAIAVFGRRCLDGILRRIQKEPTR